MEKIAIIIAEKLIEDLMESSSSSDEDDEIFAVLKALDEPKTDEKSVYNKEKATETNEIVKQTPAPADNSNEEEVAATNVPNQQSLPADSNKDREIAISSVLKRLEVEKTNLEQEVKAAFKEGRFLNFEDKVMNMISERNFKHNFHVSRATAIYLMEKYSLWYYKTPYKKTKVKSKVETDILSFLWFSANNTSFRNIAQLFIKSVSQIRNCFKIVLQFLIEELAEEVIKFPKTNQEKAALAEEFETVAGFPNVLGCFAESFFTVKIPKLIQHCGGSNVYLRGICDAKSKFLYVKTGIPREIVDTFLEKDLPTFCSSDYHLLGDAKCPIREYLMIPFDNDGNLSEAEKNFNIKLIRTHVKIKKAFGLLRNRFQQLNYLDFETVETMSEFIVSCCILHNICIDREDLYNEEICTDVSDRLYACSLSNIKNDEFLSDLGLMKRFELKHMMFTNKT